MHSCIYLRPPSSSPDRPAPGVSVFLRKEKDDISPPWDHAPNVPICASQSQRMAPSKRQKPNPATEPEFGATEHSQSGAEADLVELRAWRDALLQPTQTAGAIFNMQKPRGQVSYGASDLAGRPQRFDGVSARGLPARHYACPTHADLPQPLPGRVDRLPFWLEQAAPPRPPLTILRLITHAWRAQVDVLRGSHRANLALEPTAFH